MEINLLLFLGVLCLMVLVLTFLLYPLVFVENRREILSSKRSPREQPPDCPICEKPARVIIRKSGVVVECTDQGCSHIWLQQGFIKVICECPACLTPQPPLAA